MSNVSKGFAYEREVKKHFVDAGWGCTRAAHSASAMDLIAFTQKDELLACEVFEENGYDIMFSKSKKIPLNWLASKIEDKYIKHVYFQTVGRAQSWYVVLMQCKISKRQKRKR